MGGKMTGSQAVADLAQIQGEVRIVNAARNAHAAWLRMNEDRRRPDLSNHYTAKQAETDFTLAMLRLGNALDKAEQKEDT